MRRNAYLKLDGRDSRYRERVKARDAGNSLIRAWMLDVQDRNDGALSTETPDCEFRKGHKPCASQTRPRIGGAYGAVSL
jgi:hypothetical protein